MVIGFSCRVASRIPTVVGVRVHEADDGPAAEIVLDHRVAKYASWADAIALIAGEVETLLGQQPMTAAVIKTLEDRTPNGAPKVTDATRLRLQIEGALLVICQRQGVGFVAVMTGQEIGKAMGTDKAGATQRAGAILSDGRDVANEAAAAALAAMATSSD